MAAGSASWIRITAALVCVAALVTALAATETAAAAPGELPASKRVAIPTPPSPGPASLDQVFVRKSGPANASCVLVLVPGGGGGQGNFAWVQDVLARRVDDLAVWSLDRRSNALEDTAPFVTGTSADALDYYFLGGEYEGSRFVPWTGDTAPWARQWGAPNELRDLRRVVRRADRGGRCVILGGHSFGALEASAYASWDFAGRPGFRDLDGLVLIDGGLFSAFRSLLSETGFQPIRKVARIKARLETLATRTPFGSDETATRGAQPEWQVSVIPELICDYALEDPDAPAKLNAQLQTGVETDLELTREALAGLFINQVLTDQGARVGRLAADGSPRAWVPGRRSNVIRFCQTFTQEPGNGLDWYFPIRLEVDLAQGMNSMERTPVSRYLGLRPFHTSEIDLPLYALQTSLTDGGVLRAAHKLVRRSRISETKFVDAATMRHFDPLVDVPRHNRFLRSVQPFLGSIVADHRRAR